MQAFIGQLICGIELGSIYAIVVIGYNMLLLVTSILHWGYAHLLVLSMYVAWLVFGVTNNSLALGVPTAIVFGIMAGAVLAPLFLPFIRRGAHLEGFVISAGIASIIVEIQSHWINYGLPIAFPPALLMEDNIIRFGLSTISVGRLLTLGVSIILMFAFFYFLNRSKQGRMLRAVAQDSVVARILGISVRKMIILSFALSGLLAGITAVCLAVALGTAGPSLGDQLAIKCLGVLILASAGNLKGGLVCAIIFGVLDSMIMGYLPGDWANTSTFLVIVGVLMFKPGGLFSVRN